MKKYILSLFVFGFVLFPILSFAEGTGSSTGQCVAVINNLKYQDRDIYKNGEVSTLQTFLQGRGYLNTNSTGYFGSLTFNAVKSFQNANGLTPDGVVGPITRGVVRNLTCGNIYPNQNNPTISGVSGPQSLNVNQTGTWTVNATDSSGGNLAYSVNWGDVMVYNNTGATTSSEYPIQQSATFTHTYSSSGTFNPTFTVTNSSGQSASTSLSVNVTGNNQISTITVLSPNGGETLIRGNYFQINWQDNISSASILPTYYDIYLNYYYPPCTGICPLSETAVLAPLTIAQNVYGSSYNWQVGNVSLNGTIAPSVNNASYTISVCRAGTSVCDSSDNPFTIQ